MRIMIVDDDVVSRRVLEAMLTERGHECEVAADGTDAWEVFQRFHPNVVITDWLMPGMDGPELCRRIRSSMDTGYAYLILLTSFSDHERALAGMHAGADDYLIKPLNAHQLETRLVAAERVSVLHDRLAGREAELEQLNARLRDESRRDPLTGLGNRLRLLEDLEVLEARAWRHGHGYGVGLVDVDQFKIYNDHHGHLAGDEVLRAVAGALAGALRSADCAYRFGGEEILIVLPEQTEESAMAALERMRQAVEDLAIPHPGNEPPGIVTISAGVAIDDGDRADDVLRRADTALYRAKETGRNRVVLDGGEAAEAPAG